MNKLFRGQGPLLIQVRNKDGTYGPIAEMGSVTAAQFSPTVSELKHRESSSGRRAVDKVIETETDCTVSLTVENFDVEALAVHLRSDIAADAGGAFVDVVVGDLATLSAGDVFRVPGLGLTGVTLSATHSGVDTPLVAGTHYEAISGAHGFYRLLDKTGYSGVIKADGTKAPTKSVNAISRGKVTAKVMFLGINTAEDDEPQLVEALVSLQPASAFSLISDQFGSYEVKGDCLYVDGGFFKATMLA